MKAIWIGEANPQASLAFSQAGVQVIRSDVGLEPLSMACAEARSEELCLVAENGAATWIAEAYFQIYHLCRPLALVLVRPQDVRLVDLNNVTCPYLVINLSDDFWGAEKEAWTRVIHEAVSHHQMRYGDTTQVFVSPTIEEQWSEIAAWTRSAVEWGARRLREEAKPELLDGVA